MKKYITPTIEVVSGLLGSALTMNAFSQYANDDIGAGAKGASESCEEEDEKDIDW